MYSCKTAHNVLFLLPYLLFKRLSWYSLPSVIHVCQLHRRNERSLQLLRQHGVLLFDIVTSQIIADDCWSWVHCESRAAVAEERRRFVNTKEGERQPLEVVTKEMGRLTGKLYEKCRCDGLRCCDVYPSFWKIVSDIQKLIGRHTDIQHWDHISLPTLFFKIRILGLKLFSYIYEMKPRNSNSETRQHSHLVDIGRGEVRWGYFTTDGHSVSMSWYRAPLWDLRPDVTSCRNVAVWNLRSCFCLASCLTRGRVCNLQCNFSVVRVAQNRNHTLLSHLRLSQPGGPGSRIYIPQEQGGPVIPPGTGLISGIALIILYSHFICSLPQQIV
jgi:hypothetical protein